MKQSRKELKFTKSPSIKKRLVDLTKHFGLVWVKPGRLFVYSSTGSKTRAYARTWGLPRVWQSSLKVDPAYIIEVISEHFLKLSDRDQDRVLLHELTHIPRNFSGALVPHTHRKKGSFRDKLERLYEDYHTARGKRD
jgi:predicted metallopeptidase